MLQVNSSGAPVPFSVQTATGSGQNWLVVTPRTGIAPATLTVTADPAKLAGVTQDDGVITVAGAGNTKTVRVQFTVNTDTLPPVLFSIQAGTLAHLSREILRFQSTGAVVESSPAAPWLSVAAGLATITVSVNPAGLPPGAYEGSVALTGVSGQLLWHVPVKLFV